MEFGVFYQLPCAEEQSPAARYADTLAQARLADELGFDSVPLAEHDYDPARAKINVNVPVYVTEDRKKARATLEPSFNNYLGLISSSRLRASRGRKWKSPCGFLPRRSCHVFSNLSLRLSALSR